MINPAPGFWPIFGPLGPTAGPGSPGNGPGSNNSAGCTKNQPRRPIVSPKISPGSGEEWGLTPPHRSIRSHVGIKKQVLGAFLGFRCDLSHSRVSDAAASSFGCGWSSGTFSCCGFDCCWSSGTVGCGWSSSRRRQRLWQTQPRRLHRDATVPRVRAAWAPATKLPFLSGRGHAAAELMRQSGN